MDRIIDCGVVLFLIWGHALWAANPEDIEFRVRLVKDTFVYHTGESIEVELLYSSQSEKKYYGSFVAPMPELEGVAPHVTPLDGVLDLRELRRDRINVFSILGSPGYVNSKPRTQQLDLCRWYRFRRPGHYSVTFTSREVSRVKGAEEGGGRERVLLESNPVDFDILPADAAWVAGEISDIQQAMSRAKVAGERELAIRRLGLLDTPAAVKALVQFYLANSHAEEDWIFDSALSDSSQLDAIISLFEAALSDPATNIPSDLPRLLADLQTRKELGVTPAYPSDAAQQQKWTDESKVHEKVHDKYLEQANALLTASIERRSGPQRATAIYQAWLDANQLRASTAPPEALSRLESNLLAVAHNLDRARQVQFIVTAWQTMPREELHPLIREIAMDSVSHPAVDVTHEGFTLWCKGWPEECAAGILQKIIETNVRIDKNVVLMMPEAEHPELDEVLETQLKDPAVLRDLVQSQRLAAVALRAGSRNLVSPVDSFLDQYKWGHGCDGETVGNLLGYLLRVAPEDARRRLKAELQKTDGSCGSEVLRILHSFRPSDDVIPVVTDALDSPNFAVAQTAALYLAAHGPASSEDAIWRRLEALWDEWQATPSDLPDEMMAVVPDKRAAQASMLERALASALSHAVNWKLGSAELDRLRSGCLTKTCRDIADGRLSLNL